MKFSWNPHEILTVDEELLDGGEFVWLRSEPDSSQNKFTHYLVDSHQQHIKNPLNNRFENAHKNKVKQQNGEQHESNEPITAKEPRTEITANIHRRK